MRLSELAETTGASPATLKFYLRSGLLPAGRAVTRTQSDYGEDHVRRVRLIRALSEVGGLGLDAVGRVLDAVDDEGHPPLEVMAVAQRTLLDDRTGQSPVPDEWSGRARGWLARRGWAVPADDPAVAHLARAWAACGQAGLGVDDARLDRYADAVERVAEIDLATVPTEPAAAVRQIILGTVLVESLLAALRLLAHQHVAVTGARDDGEGDGSGAGRDRADTDGATTDGADAHRADTDGTDAHRARTDRAAAD